LHPGDKLPPERELVNMLGVSRPSLREALRALAIMNIIEMRQGDGTYITALEPQQLFEHLELVFNLDKSTLHQLFEARKVIEVGCVGLAAVRIDDETLAHLKNIVARSEESVEDAEAFLQADVELHETIIQATGNSMLVRFMGSISQLGMASRRVTGGSARVRRASIEDHKAILAALAAHDAEAARTAMLHHLDNVEKSLDFD
jgi:GntR family transcriptional repressor for pyruvate dehydrogenase complex